MSSIVNHPVFERAVKALDNGLVREKLVRLVQYFARFLSWYFYRKGYSKSSISKAALLSAQLSLVNKVLRSGKPVGMLRGFLKELSNETSDPLVHYLTLGKSLFYGLYFGVDIFVWLNSHGLYVLDQQASLTLKNTALRVWLVGIVCSWGIATYDLYKAEQQLKALKQDQAPEKNTKTLKEVAAAHHKASHEFIVSACDFLIPSTLLGLFNFDDGVVGIAGTVSSYLGLLPLL